MARFNFRIGTKLGLTAGIGVVLVAGMLVSQMVSNESIAELSRMVVINTDNKANAQAADSAMARARLAAQEISVAPSADRLEKSLQALRTSFAEAVAEIDLAVKRARRPAAQELYREAKTLIDASLTAGNEFAAARGAVLAGFAARNQTADAWNRGLDQLLTSPRLAASPHGTEIHLRDAAASFNAARAAGWRYAATAEPEQRDLITGSADLVISALKRARALATEKDIQTGIDGLVATADRFKIVAGLSSAFL